MGAKGRRRFVLGAALAAAALVVGGLLWWSAAGPAVEIERTYTGVLWRNGDEGLCREVTVRVSGVMDRRTFSGDIRVEELGLETTGVRVRLDNGHAFLDTAPHDYLDEPYLASVLEEGDFAAMTFFVAEPVHATEGYTESRFGGASALLISAPCTDRAEALAVFQQLREAHPGLHPYISDMEWN